MAGSWDGSYDQGSQSEESFHEKYHLEPIYEAFVCPLTKQVMKDPVTLENGQTFERQAIENWFKECRDSGRRPICPLTLKELSTTELNPSIALWNTIEEWTARNETRGSRYVAPYIEGLTRVLARLTYVLAEEREATTFAQEHSLAMIFVDHLRMNGLDNVQMVSAAALENLSRESKRLTVVPDPPEPGFCLFSCFSKPPLITGLCPVHQGMCSLKETFCLLEGKAVGKLVGCLDHENVKVVEAALAALCTLLDDEVDIEQGVNVLCEADGIKPILEILLENRSEVLRKRSVWAVERILRSEDIAFEVSGNQNVGTALVEAYRHGDYRTKQVAELALKKIDKLPNFSGIFQKMG
ncbi:U-box domain-containing protein 44 [Acorus calamus]|uniref:RING-type E3 ubiquitin transferase n=1 Tax=Acorus calamus TaxID=4465 RepID=A0AAV9D5D3_ACOCL|nr:U-box domain-containing protein 44 [Acorus calamus]